MPLACLCASVIQPIIAKLYCFSSNNAKVTGYWIRLLTNIGYLFYCCGIFFPFRSAFLLTALHIFLFINEASNFTKAVREIQPENCTGLGAYTVLIKNVLEV